ncbi:hypothetical protein CHCC20335_0364 [Bacillus paralicheniformis]|nr:hypothetical protein CHCC20335_0364 [Bacillus paralicheniformis]
MKIELFSNRIKESIEKIASHFTIFSFAFMLKLEKMKRGI